MRGAMGYGSGMRDRELYRHLLGLSEPWAVSRVELKVSERRVDAWVEHSKGQRWTCGECGQACPLHDHESERSWRHLDSCHFQTYLQARVPRVNCPEHGVRQVRVPWAEPMSRFTLLFERLAIDVLMETSVEGGAALLGLSWDEAHHIMERAVVRGLARREVKPPRQMGVDEKSFRRGQDYVTVLNDLEKGCVVEVAQGRSKKALLECLKDYTPNQLAQVEAVAMDMAAPYIELVKDVVPEAQSKIVFDRYHIAAHVNKAVDQVRRQENRALCKQEDQRLVGTKYWWLYGEENLPERYQLDFDALRASNLKTGRAWAIKESLRQFWNCPDAETGAKLWKRWYFWATHSRLEPVKRVAAMIERHLPNVMTYFVHPITNAVSEGLNTTIQMLKKRAYGYRSFANFRVAILFHCGGLELYPVVPAVL